MTDGNTAIQVSPTEDSEMATVRQTFDKALNAIIAMSQLSKEVDQLRSDVSSMQGQVDHLRRQNEWLDETVAKLRDERTNLSTKLAETQQTAATVKRDNDQLNAYNASLSTENDTLRSAKHDAEQARDEAQLKIMELEDEIKGHVAKLDKFHEVAKQLFPSEAKVETSLPVTQPEPVPVEVHQEVAPIPYVAVEAETGITAPSPTRTYHGTTWQAGYIWDSNKQEYYSEF